jgi:hypothetical protein
MAKSRSGVNKPGLNAAAWASIFGVSRVNDHFAEYSRSPIHSLSRYFLCVWRICRADASRFGRRGENHRTGSQSYRFPITLTSSHAEIPIIQLHTQTSFIITSKKGSASCVGAGAQRASSSTRSHPFPPPHSPLPPNKRSVALRAPPLRRVAP